MTRAASRAEPGAGHPFLEFLNTVSDDGKSRGEDSFADAQELRGVLVASGIDMPADIPARQLDAMLRLRESAYAVFSALAAGRDPGREEHLFLDTELRRVIGEAELRITREGLITAPGPEATPLDRLVLSMDDLMRSDQFTRLRECRRCTHLFLDQGRGVGRRWCSMARCGNRAKAEKFRARHRDAA